MKQNEITVGRFLRIVLVVIVLVAAYFVVNSLSGVLLPFAIAWLLAYMLNPLVNLVQEKMRVKYRALAIFLSMVAVGGALYGLFMLVLPSMFRELYALKDITVAFLGKNINDGSIPEPIMAFFKEISTQYGFAEILQNSGDSGLVTVLAERAQMLLLGTVDIMGQVLSVSLIMLYLFFILFDVAISSRHKNSLLWFLSLYHRTVLLKRVFHNRENIFPQPVHLDKKGMLQKICNMPSFIAYRSFRCHSGPEYSGKWGTYRPPV